MTEVLLKAPRRDQKLLAPVNPPEEAASAFEHFRPVRPLKVPKTDQLVAVPTGIPLHRFDRWFRVGADPEGDQGKELPTREGFGARLLKRVLTVQTGADVKIDYDPDRLRVSVAVPLEMSK